MFCHSFFFVFENLCDKHVKPMACIPSEYTSTDSENILLLVDY